MESDNKGLELSGQKKKFILEKGKVGGPQISSANCKSPNVRTKGK